MRRFTPMKLQENTSSEYDYTLHLTKQELVDFHVAVARAKTTKYKELNKAIWKEMEKLNPKLTGYRLIEDE